MKKFNRNFLGVWIFCFLEIYFFSYYACASLKVNKNSNAIPFSAGTVPVKEADIKKLGLFKTSNVLSCERVQYANWFFPVERLNDCIGFFDIAKRKFGGFDAINPKLQPQAEEKLQCQALICYLDCLKNYLCIMAPLYPSNCSWHTEQKKAVGKIDDFITRLKNDNNVRDIKNALKQRDEMSNIWNCVHTEPLCVFDHIQSEESQGFRVLEFEGSEFNFLETPVIMYSRWRPCSQFNCGEMLEEVAKIIGCNIEFNYYL